MWPWCLIFRKGKKVEGVEWGCRQEIPISILFFKLWLDKRETGLQRPIQKAQTANSSQACAGSVVSHLSTLLGINVSSPALDPTSHLALPSHTHDFINPRHHMQSTQVSQEAAGWVLTPPGHRKPKNTAHDQMAFWSSRRQQCCRNNYHTRRPVKLELGLFKHGGGTMDFQIFISFLLLFEAPSLVREKTALS